jgi:hypothetical protein
MTSSINPTNIDITYPIAGQDNDTKGFRDNFTVIKNNFSVARSEITAVQAILETTPTLVTPPPVSPSSFGTVGQISYDSTYFYLCIATNTWKRIQFGAW